jgi:hypothetical protein
MIEGYRKKGKKSDKSLIKNVYIGVYTREETESSYKIVVTKKNGFSPLLLMDG